MWSKCGVLREVAVSAESLCTVINGTCTRRAKKSHLSFFFSSLARSRRISFHLCGRPSCLRRAAALSQRQRSGAAGQIPPGSQRSTCTFLILSLCPADSPGFYFDGTTEVSFDTTQNAAQERHTFIVMHNTVLLPEGPV